jgi:hypothetical protein
MKIEIETPKVFQPLLAPARYKGAWGGRGSGKSWFFAGEAVLAALQLGTRFLCAREVQRSLKESSKRLIEARIEALSLGSFFDVKRDEIHVRRGGGVIIFSGLQDHTAESIKSLEGINRVWVDEAQAVSARSLELLRPTIRKPGSELWFSWNPRSTSDAVDEMFRTCPPPSAVCVKANYSDNPWFPAELDEERAHDRKTRPHRYAHVWDGDYEPIDSDAIWRWDDINRYRRHETPEMGRIVIGVDHAVSEGPKSATHGIVVAGKGADGRAYVLADVSVKGAPDVWAKKVVAAFGAYSADAIVIERNQGGDLIRHTLQAIRSGLPIIEVMATRGKHVRAEPIAALYGLGKVSHIGTFPELEAEMVKMTTNGYGGEGSPDRCDALVWALSHLFPSIVREAPKAVSKHWQPQGEHGWMG